MLCEQFYFRFEFIIFAGDETTIHGLDTLIEYYQEDNHGLEIQLKVPIKGVPPPHDTRRHGRTNLLHRATIQVRLFDHFCACFFII